VNRVSDFAIPRNTCAGVVSSTTIIRAVEEYKASLFDFADGRVEWPQVITRIRALRRSLARQRSLR
jgi:hypothetical protein